MAKRHAGNLERRGDSYRARLSVRGKRHYFTIPTSDRRVAERMAAQRLRELERDYERQAAGLPGTVRVSELLELFEAQELPTRAPGTQAAYRKSLRLIRTYFVEALGDPPVSNIHGREVSAFLAWRRVHRQGGGRPVSNRTVQRDRAVLHCLFALAERMEFREGNPVARVAPPKADPRDPVILNDQEFERLLKACAHNPMLWLYVLLLAETGARSGSEALYLRWEDVNLKEGFVWIASGRDGHRTKSGKGRWIPMTPRLQDALKDHFARFHFATYGGVRSLWVFHHTRSRRNHRMGERIGSLRNAFNNAVARAELPAEVHQHDLRHRRVTTWLAEGKNAVHVKEAMGHSDLRVTMGYTHLAREHLRSLVEAAIPAVPVTARSS